MELFKLAAVCLISALSLSACVEGNSSSSRQPTQLSLQDVAAIQLYQRGNYRSFYDGGLVPKVVSAAVLFHQYGGGEHDEIKGNAFYFRVAVGTSKTNFQPRDRLPDGVLGGISKPELVALHSDLIARKTSGRVMELAKSAASQTICATGTVKLDDRPISEAKPLTPSEQVRVNAALGGNLDRILGMKTSDLDRLGIGFLLNRETRPLPSFRYKTEEYSGTTSAQLRMKCVF